MEFLKNKKGINFLDKISFENGQIGIVAGFTAGGSIIVTKFNGWGKEEVIGGETYHESFDKDNKTRFWGVTPDSVRIIEKYVSNYDYEIF